MKGELERTKEEREKDRRVSGRELERKGARKTDG
jgi:hypothetical protein